MNGDRYRALLRRLNLTKALQCQLHAGFKSDFSHAVDKYEPLYLPGSDDRKFRPPPLTEDLSHLCDAQRRMRAKKAVRAYWKRMTPEQRAVQIGKRRNNARSWREKCVSKGTIRLREFTTKYLVIKSKPRKPKTKKTMTKKIKRGGSQ